MKINLIGQHFGKLVVIEEAKKPEGSKSTSAFWLCECDCGTRKIISGNSLRQGRTKSCGCAIKERKNYYDLLGQRFGSLVVIEKVEKPKNLKSSGAYWLCQCDCGNTKIILGKSLKNGYTTTCGCHINEMTDIKGQHFGKLTALKVTPHQKGKRNTWLCQCDCGNYTTVTLNNLLSGSVQSCGCLISKGEEEIKKLLLQHNIVFSQQFTFPDLKGEKNGLLRFDFAIFDTNNHLQYLIEFQGEQHYSFSGSKFFDDATNNDKLKRNYCIEHNIPLIEIPYWKRNKISIEDLLLETQTERYGE